MSTSPLVVNGIISGINTTQVIQALLQGYAQPITQLQTQQGTLASTASDYKTLNTDMFASFKREAGGMPGVLYGESDYFTLKAVSVDNATWTSDQLLPRGNWAARDPNPVVHASLSRLV